MWHKIGPTKKSACTNIRAVYFDMIRCNFKHEKEIAEKVYVYAADDDL